MQDRARGVFHSHRRVWCLASGLRRIHKALHHLRARVSDVDLPAGNSKGSPIQRKAARQPCNGVLCGRIVRRIRAWNMRGYRAVVYDPPALRVLVAHESEGFASAQEHAVQVHVDALVPIVQSDLVNRAARCKYPGVVEQNIQPPRAVHEGPKARSTASGSVTSAGRTTTA